MPTFYTKRPVASKPSYSPRQNPNPDEDPLKTLLDWDAPSRPFRKRDRSFFTTSAVLILLISLILLLAQEYFAILALLAFLFVTYVLNLVPPEEVKYKITTQGITIGDHFYVWHDLGYFWFTEKDGHKIVHISTEYTFPSMLIFPLGDQTEDSIRKILSHYLIFLEVAPKTMMDSWAERLQKHFPLENPAR